MMALCAIFDGIEYPKFIDSKTSLQSFLGGRLVDGKEWRKCLEQQPKTYLSSSGPVIVARTLYRPADGGKSTSPLELRNGIIGGCTRPFWHDRFRT